MGCKCIERYVYIYTLHTYIYIYIIHTVDYALTVSMRQIHIEWNTWCISPAHLEVRPCGGATTQEGGPSVEEVRRHTGAARFLPDLLLSL